MRLERIFTHRLIRALRLTIPLLVLVLIAIPGWNYLSRRTPTLPPRVPHQLPKNLDVRTEGFTYSRTEGGKTLFTIRANTTLGFKDNKYTLEDVDVTVFGKVPGDFPKRIRSKRCSYDQQTNNFRFEDDVDVQLDQRTTVRTQELTYDQQGRTVVSSQKAAIEQPGSMNGWADSFQYALDTGVLTLDGNVHVTMLPQTSLEAGSAVFQQKENWAAMAGGVLIKSGTGWIRGQVGRADLEAGTYKPKTIVLEIDVRAESQAQRGVLWKLRASRIEADISPEGNAERVRTRGTVEVERWSGDSRQLMAGEEMDATLDATGKVSLIEARQNASMIFGPERKLHSNRIWSNAAGEIATQEDSLLQVGDSVIEGRQFTIRQGDIVSFSTPARANLRSGERRTSAERTDGRFDSRTNSLVELAQTGNFRFVEGTRRAVAQAARFENGGTVITLDGSPIVTDTDMRVEAGQIHLNQQESSFVATGNVKTVTKNSDQPILVRASRAERANDKITYTENVQLWRGNAYIGAEKLEAFSSSNRLHAEGRVQSDVQGVRASSDKLDYDEASREAHYKGNVRAQKQGMTLQTFDMTARIHDKDIEEIVATGGVIVTQGDRRGTGDHAVYESSTDTVTLTGPNAEVYDKEQGTVHGTRLVMNIKGDTVAAEGGKNGRSLTRHSVKK